jgi:hypothetical protein
LNRNWKINCQKVKFVLQTLNPAEISYKYET